MSDNNKELKNILEAAMLVSGRTLTIDNMLALFPKDSKPTRDEIKAAITQLQHRYADTGIELKQIARGYRFQSREKYTEWLGRLSEEKPARYSRASMETLAIIAYRQPVTRGDIEQIRGVSVSTDIIRTLTEREWVREVGHRDVPGKPALFGTTRTFLEYFNLKGLDELPTLNELRNLEEISQELNLPLEFAETDEAASDQVQDAPKQISAAVDDVDDETSNSAPASTDDMTDDEEQGKTALSAAPAADSST